jgi:hypothetical protein
MIWRAVQSCADSRGGSKEIRPNSANLRLLRHHHGPISSSGGGEIKASEFDIALALAAATIRILQALAGLLFYSKHGCESKGFA